MEGGRRPRENPRVPGLGQADRDFWGYPLPALGALRTLYTGGHLGAMAEVTAQYAGWMQPGMAVG